MGNSRKEFRWDVMECVLAAHVEAWFGIVKAGFDGVDGGDRTHDLQGHNLTC